MTWEGQGNVVQGLLQQLREDVARLDQVVTGGDLAHRVQLAEAHLMELRNHAEDLQELVDRLVSEARETSSQTRRLDARVLWLERRIRLSETPVLELDDVDVQLLRLADAAEAGHQAQLALLSPLRRQQLTATVVAFETDVETVRSQQDLALTAAVALADTRYGTAEHRAAGGDFRTARSRMSTAQDRVARNREAAQQARQELRGDDARRAESTETIARGDQAWAELWTRLRTAVAEAVGTAALLPSWFTTVLGPMPPAEDTELWMDTAVGLVTYRITYRVGDPVIALGPAPGPGAGTRQRLWWQELDAAIRSLQR